MGSANIINSGLYIDVYSHSYTMLYPREPTALHIATRFSQRDIPGPTRDPVEVLFLGACLDPGHPVMFVTEYMPNGAALEPRVGR